MLRAMVLAVLVPVSTVAATGPAPEGDAEQTFLAEMSMHHAGAIDMARLVENTTAHPAELAPFARSIIQEQEAEVRQMEAWLQAWYGQDAARMDHAMMGKQSTQMERMMSELEGKEGNTFDMAFLEQMIMHHGSAIEMAQGILTKDVHAETRGLAEGIIDSQQAEIGQMRAWQAAWANQTDAGTGGDNANGTNRTQESADRETPPAPLVLVVIGIGLLALARRRRA